MALRERIYNRHAGTVKRPKQLIQNAWNKLHVCSCKEISFYRVILACWLILPSNSCFFAIFYRVILACLLPLPDFGLLLKDWVNQLKRTGDKDRNDRPGSPKSVPVQLNFSRTPSDHFCRVTLPVLGWYKFHSCALPPLDIVFPSPLMSAHCILRTAACRTLLEIIVNMSHSKIS